MPLPLDGSAAPRMSSGVVEVIDQVERLGMPAAVEPKNVNRAELDGRFVIRELAHDRANPAAVRAQQRASTTRRPQRQPGSQATLDALGKSGAALARGIGVAGRKPIC